MRGSKKGPHKCFKTLTDRLTPKYVCPSKGKAGVTALSTMGTRPERAEELEAMGEVRKPPKQQRETEADPIAILDQKEKAREKRHLLRMKTHPTSMHAEDSEEAVHKKPDTLHYETDEEAVEKAINEVLGVIEQEIRKSTLNLKFSSVYKSLSIGTDLHKAEAPQGGDVSSFLKENDIKAGETFKDYFKRKSIDTDSIDKFTKKNDPAHSISPGSFTLGNSRDKFLHTPIDELYSTYKGEVGRSKFNSKINPVKVTLSHYNSLSGKSPYKGSDIEKFKKEQSSQVSKLDAGINRLYGKTKSGPAIKKPTSYTAEDTQRAKVKDVVKKWDDKAFKRINMLTKEGQDKKLDAVALTAEILSYLVPSTTAGRAIFTGGSKMFSPPVREALGHIGTKITGPGAAYARTKILHAVLPVVMAGGSPAGHTALITTLQAAAKGKNVAQVMQVLKTGAQATAKVAPKVAHPAAKVAAKAAPAAAKVAAKAAPRLTGAQAAIAGAGAVLSAQQHSGASAKAPAKASAEASAKAPEKAPAKAPAPAAAEASASETAGETASKTKEGKRKGGRGKKPELQARKRKTIVDDKTTKLPKRKKTPSSVASVEERTEDAVRKREKRRGKIESDVKEASQKAAKRRTKERYQTIGETSKKFAQVVRKSISTMDDYSDLYKSKSYLGPIVRQVLNKRISFKEALDKVPWHMQAELLKELQKRA